VSESFFAGIEPVRYEGPETDNPLAYRWYDRERVVLGRRMEDHLRFAVCFWHSFGFAGADAFGRETMRRPWTGAGDEMALAERKIDAAFEFFTTLGAPFFTFHDRDVAPEAASLRESAARLDRMADRIACCMERTAVRLLWGTANLFSHPRYAAGAATSPDPEVFACAAQQVRHALEVTQRLGGANYVLWGGREGYDTLLNTDMRRETQQLGRFLGLVAEHRHRIGFEGTLLIEPKPMEPAKHQYDFDAAAVHALLRQHGLETEYKLNVEVNHATLAGHSFEHELAYAAACGLLGSVDINRGDPQNGWDTDQFPNSAEEAARAFYVILRAGGLGSGGFNFDAKLRRQSVALDDLVHAHVGGVDTLARGLLAAARLIEDGGLGRNLEERYAGWDGELGREILAGRTSLAALADLALARDFDPQPRSGGQERLENLVNRFV